MYKIAKCLCLLILAKMFVYTDTTAKTRRQKSDINHEAHAIYQRRLLESEDQLIFYVRFLSNPSLVQSKKISYQNRLNALFDKESEPSVRTNQGDCYPYYELADSLACYANRSCSITIDSIGVPIWVKLDKKTLKKDTLVSSVQNQTLDIRIKPFAKRSMHSFGSEEESEQDKELHILKIETENGFEWVPLFGDLYITINKEVIKKDDEIQS